MNNCTQKRKVTVDADADADANVEWQRQRSSSGGVRATKIGRERGRVRKSTVRVESGNSLRRGVVALSLWWIEELLWQAQDIVVRSELEIELMYKQ